MKDNSKIIANTNEQIKECQDKISNPSNDKKEVLYNKLNSLLEQENKLISMFLELNIIPITN